MPEDPYDEVPSRLLSLFTSPVIKRNDIVYPGFVEKDTQIENIGVFSRPIPRMHCVRVPGGLARC